MTVVLPFQHLLIRTSSSAPQSFFLPHLRQTRSPYHRSFMLYTYPYGIMFRRRLFFLAIRSFILIAETYLSCALLLCIGPFHSPTYSFPQIAYLIRYRKLVLNARKVYVPRWYNLLNMRFWATSKHRLGKIYWRLIVLINKPSYLFI